MLLFYVRHGEPTYNPDRVAFFAHHGFGMGFLSSMLDLPFPLFSIHFNMDFTGVTVIEFKNENGICYPRVLTLSDDAIYTARG